MRAHAHQLADVLVAVVPHVLVDDARARYAHQQRRELRLTVRREARVRHRLDVHPLERLDRRVKNQRFVVFRDLYAHLAELRRNGLQMLWCDVGYRNLAACRRRRTHIGARFDLIGNDRIGDAVHRAYAADLDDVGSRASDVRSHRVEEVREVDDVRLLRRVLDDRQSLCAARRKHDVHRRADRYHVEINMRSDKSLLAAGRFDDRAVYESCLRAERLKALEVLVDRPYAEIAAARKRHSRVAVFAEQRAQQIIGCSHAHHKLARRGAGMNVRRVNVERALVDPFYLRAHLL